MRTVLPPAFAPVLAIIVVQVQLVVQEPCPPPIIAALQAAPLLEQKRAAKAWVGMKVRRQVTFENVIFSVLTLTLKNTRLGFED